VFTAAYICDVTKKVKSPLSSNFTRGRNNFKSLHSNMENITRFAFDSFNKNNFVLQ
jgi:hypothetical protein